MKTKWNRKGITLLELIIAIGLVTVVTLAIYTVLNTGMRTFQSNLTSSQDQGNLRNAMMQLSKLEHKGSASCSTNTVTISISGTDHVVQVKNKKLVDVAGSSTTTLANDIITLNASKSGSIITVTLTGTSGETLSTQFNIGN